MINSLFLVMASVSSASLLLIPAVSQADETKESAENTNGVTCAEIVEAIDLHLSVQDPMFEGFARNKALIVENPKMAAPLVMQRLLFAEDQYEASGAANLLIEMDYDREKIRVAVKNVMSRAQSNLKGKLQQEMLTETARILGRIGTPEDAEALLPLLKHSDKLVQINAADALGEIADAEAVPKIEKFLEQHAQGMSAEGLREDLNSDRKEYSFLHEGFQAIAKIQYRALLQEQIKEKSEE